MVNYGVVRGDKSPELVEINVTGVYVASDIQPYEEEIVDDDNNTRTMSGYQYNYILYTKDEYLVILTKKNAELDQKNAELEDELQATKIILGVE